MNKAFALSFSFPRLAWAFALLLASLTACQPPAQEAAATSLPSKNTPVSLAGPQLIVLGVAQDAGFPQADCRKSCCSRAWEDPKLRRSATCLALHVPENGQRWLFEATPDFRMQVRELDRRAPRGAEAVVDGIFLTHAHMGHYTGLMHLGREAMGAKAVPVYAMPRMRQFLRENGPWSQLADLGNIALRSLAADSAVALTREIRVTPMRVPHRDEFSETVGFRIDGPARSAVFIPDIDKWDRWDRDIAALVRDVDYAFLDATFFAEGEIPGRNMSEIPHPFVQESMGLLGSLPAEDRKKVFFIHFNHTNPLLDRESAARAQVLEAGFHIAEEGMALPL